MTNRSGLKAYFNTGDTITEANVADLIDSLFSLADDDYLDVPGLSAQLDAKQNSAIYCIQITDRTLTSTTSAQRLFDESANGAVTLPVGYYRFESGLYLTAMSATSGNGQFFLLGSGTASLSNILYQTTGNDNNGLVLGTRSGVGSVTENSVSSIANNASATALIATLTGVFQVTTAGTLIPSIALTTAAAAIVKAGSYFIVNRLGASEIGGDWS
jgi:hypothetical protein